LEGSLADCEKTSFSQSGGDTPSITGELPTYHGFGGKRSKTEGNKGNKGFFLSKPKSASSFLSPAVKQALCG
jgi:hypothetical protein